MSATHFDAELRPGPDVPDRSPDDVLVKTLHKVTQSLELLEGLGLDPPDLCLGDAPQEVVKWRLVRASRWPGDVCVAGDDAVPKLLP